MWIPQHLSLNNLLCYKEAQYSFKEGQAVMISGVNHFDEGQKSNGSGKSAILEAITIALLGKPLREGTSAKDLVREGEKSAEVELELRNSQTQKCLSISRTIHANTSSASLTLRVDGEEVTDTVSVRDGNDLILKLIGISREDLLNYYLISKENYTPFLRLPDSKKKEMIGRFSQANLIDPTSAQCGVDLDSIRESIQDAVLEEAKLSSKLDVYTENLYALKQPLKEEDKSSEYEEKIFALLDKIKRSGEAASELDTEIKELKADLKALPSTESVEKKQLGLEKEIEGEEADLERLTDELKELERHQAKHRKNLLGALECPSCEHKFNPSSGIDISKSEELEEKIIGHIADSNIDITYSKGLLKDLKAKLRECDAEMRESATNRNTLENQILRKEGQIDSIEDSIAQYKSSIKQYEELARAPKVTQDNSALIKDTEGKINKTKKLIKDLETALEEFKEDEKRLEEVKATLTKFTTHLSNKAIGAIEANVNDYLLKTKTDIEVQLDGYKETRSGKIRENITATISRNGAECMMGRMSSGEKARIEIAFIIAPQNLINQQAEFGGLDLVFLDEILESVDSTGVGGIMKALDSLNKTVLVITHATFDDIYDKQVVIIKGEDGLSTINADIAI